MMMNTNLIPRLTRSLIIVAFALALCAAAEMGRAQTPAPAVAAAPVAAAATPLPAGDVAAIKYDPADYHPGKPYQAKQTTPTSPKKMVTLNRGMSDNSKNGPQFVIPAGTEVEILENIRQVGTIILRYNGRTLKASGKMLDGNKTLRDIKEETRTLAAAAGTEVEVVDDTSNTDVFVRYNGTVYKVRRDKLGPWEYKPWLTPELVKSDPALYSAHGEPMVEWLEDTEVIPGLKERQPEGLWEKAQRMEYYAPGDCRVASPHIEKPRSSVPVWDMIASYNEADLPVWMNGRTERKSPREAAQKAWQEQNKSTVGIVDYVSLRPEFAKWGVQIKGGVNDDPNLSCGVLSAQDTLEYLWSKRVGFPVKADARLIRQAWDNGNAKLGIKREGKDPAGNAVSEGTETRLFDYLAPDGGYSVLSAESKAKIPTTNLPKLVSRELSLGYLDFLRHSYVVQDPSPSPTLTQLNAELVSAHKNGKFRSVPMTALLVEELKRGNVILVSGTQGSPFKLPAPDKIQSSVENTKPSYPFPRTMKGGVSHMQLITGYYVQYDLSAFDGSGGLFWEFRGNWGESYADKGYAYIPDHDLKDVYKTELVSLGLE